DHRREPSPCATGGLLRLPSPSATIPVSGAAERLGRAGSPGVTRDLWGLYASALASGVDDSLCQSYGAIESSKILVQAEASARSRTQSPAETASSSNTASSPAPMSFCSQRCASGGIQEPVTKMAAGLSPARHTSGVAHQPRGVHSLAAPRRSLGSPLATASSQASVAPSFMLLAQSYRPQPGDPVDSKVAQFANQPQNSASKALFCRLGEGVYLYGTHRVSLRVNT
ncbi:unnamed protein product, partial [Polarella glacialis]